MHGQSQGPAMRGAKKGGNGLQEAHCDTCHLRTPLADACQLLAQGLLQCKGNRAGTGALPPWAGAQREDLEQSTGSSQDTQHGEAPAFSAIPAGMRPVQGSWPQCAQTHILHSRGGGVVTRDPGEGRVGP